MSKVSDLIVRALEAEGVKYVFGLPGEENEDLLFSLENSNIKFIPTRHEQGAAFMADVWGRLTGQAGVCLATLGPGATNLITGLADAHMDKAPVVAITGQGSSGRLHKESHQYIDVVNMFKPVTKWNTSIQNPNITAEAVRKAFKLAQEEKPGVTHIELPEDVAKMETSDKVLTPVKVRRSAPDHKSIHKAIDLLRAAKSPIIIAGNGAIRKLASKHLREFVAKTNIPVVATFMGKGAISDSDPRSLMTIGLRGRDFPIRAIEKSDLVVAVGYDIAEFAPENWNSGKTIIHIDFEPAEVYENYQPAVEIIGDISAALWVLNQTDLPKYTDWFMPVRKAIENDLANYGQGENLAVPLVLSVLRKAMGEGDVILSDVGAHKMWIGRNFPVYTPGTCVISNGFASMGIAVPGGIAAKLAHPSRNVVAVTGDGGFLMNSQEIETAKRIGTPFTILLLNDNNYGLITWKQEAHTKKHFGTELTNPNFVKYAESFGVKGYNPKTKSELESVLKEAFNNNQVNLVSVDIDPSENLKLTEKLNSNLEV